MYVPVRKCETFSLNPTRRGLWNGHQVGGGGAFKAPPYKNPFRGPFDPIFCIGRVGG